jgi:hypothetical protein
MNRTLAIPTLCAAVALTAFCVAAEKTAPAGKKAAAPGKASAKSGGLELVYAVKKKTFPNGYESERLVVTLKNTGEKTALIPLVGGRGPWLTLPRGTVRYFGKDADGKQFARREFKAPRAAAREDGEKEPASAMVLKPGKSTELTGGVFDLQIPAAGKYTLWVEMEITKGRRLIPGMKTWTGKLRSNELEREFKRPTWKPKAPAEPPAKEPGAETF